MNDFHLKFDQKDPDHPRLEGLGLAIVTVLGGFLRFYHLGKNSFWYDEVCHASAAVMPTIHQAIAVLRTHIMAMPLDYLVAWIMARFSFREGILRIPAAIWGSLTLPVCYLLFRKFGNQRIALLAVFFLAISPLHIEYSQELRYYASLVFFYILCTWLLIRALEVPTRKRWATFLVTTLIGMYFHYFVLLCFITGGCWLIFHNKNIDGYPQRMKSFLITGGIVGTGLIPAILLFGKQQVPVQEATPVPVLSYPYSILVGLGWIPEVSIVPGISWIWGLLTAVFCVAGFADCLLTSGHKLKTIALSFIIQLGVIFLADCFMYFASPRQFLVLLPFVYYFCSKAIEHLFNHSSLPINQIHLGMKIQTGILVGLVGLWVLSAIPAELDYYQWDKSRAREISQRISEDWAADDCILAMPDAVDDRNALVYTFYFQTIMNRPDISEKISPVTWEELAGSKKCKNSTFLITKQLGLVPELSPLQISIIEKEGFQPILLSSDDKAHSQRLWVASSEKVGSNLGN